MKRLLVLMGFSIKWSKLFGFSKFVIADAFISKSIIDTATRDTNEIHSFIH
tara:strand:+ start:663 stop:815 length:153 start_codon:yes stop_codon:yes gene_type:complete